MDSTNFGLKEKSFICVFIDWENLEKAAKKDFNSILVYSELVKVIREVALSNKHNSQIVEIRAYGDFDTGTAGLISTLTNLGIKVCHVVTKNAHEYLKDSSDIELSLDVMDTMYNFPHITDYLFVSGDSDLRYVISRLKKHGKNVSILGFKKPTSHVLLELVNEFSFLDERTSILRELTKKEKENMAVLSVSNKYVGIVINQLYDLEHNKNKNFIGLSYFQKYIVDRYKSSPIIISEALTRCIDCEMIETYIVPNPRDPEHPTTACKLNMESIAVTIILNKSK